ncbi:MAG: hypothetical protein SFU86_07035 [Pirellulaceae bacterium]|nr:hypothetical protein [Pirellulaceae bacterium]
MNAKSIICLAFAAILPAAGCQREGLSPAVRPVEANVVALRAAMGGDKGAAPAETVAAQEPTGFGTLRGKFLVLGTPPARPPLMIDKEQDVCAPGGKQVPSETVVVGPGGELQNAVIYLETKYKAGDPKWEHADDLAAMNAEIIFDQKVCRFLTRVAAMRSTQTMKVLNSDPVGHNTKLDGDGGARPDNFTVPSNSSAFYAPGGESQQPFPVSCSIHPWMSAWCLVRNSPHFAVTDKDGNFEIKHVPAGVQLKFRVWQEKAKFISAATVAGKTDKPFGKGRLELTLEKDEVRELEFKIETKLLGG